MIEKAVILAAGQGLRLRSVWSRGPKALLELRGKPLIEHVISRLSYAGVAEICVVTGYMGGTVARYLRAIEKRYPASLSVAESSDYVRGNGASLLAAKEVTGRDPFLVVMCDHIVDPSIYRAAMNAEVFGADLVLCVDRDPTMKSQVDDATKVLLGDDGRILRIGKLLTRWDAVDTGVFLMRSRVFDALQRWKQRRLTLSNGVQSLIDEGAYVLATDVSGMIWSDIDTPQDLDETEELFEIGILQAPMRGGELQLPYGQAEVEAEED